MKHPNFSPAFNFRLLAWLTALVLALSAFLGGTHRVEVSATSFAGSTVAQPRSVVTNHSATNTAFGSPSAPAALAPLVGYTITRESSPIIYVDCPNNPASYLAYKITNTSGADVLDLWVQLAVSGDIALNEDGKAHVGFLANGASTVVYFYIKINSCNNKPSTNLTVNLYDSPALVTVIHSTTFAYTVEKGISSSANKVTTVASAPNPPVLGGLITITTSGFTGNIGNGETFAPTPASVLTWPADKLRLVDVSIKFYNSPSNESDCNFAGAPTSTFNDTLYIHSTAPILQNNTVCYKIDYIFVIDELYTSPVPVSPLTWIDSGGQGKHNEGVTTAPPDIPVPQNFMTLSKSANTTAPISGTAFTYSITVTNTGSVDAFLNSFKDTMPVGFVYVNGTTQYNDGTTTTAINNPTIVGQVHTWSSVFRAPANGTGTLTFQVTPTSISCGTFSNSAVAFVGIGANNVQIDTTLNTTDNSPAIALLSNLSPACADLSITKSDSATTVTAGTATTYTLTITNAGTSAVTGALLKDPAVTNLTVTSVNCTGGTGGATCPGSGVTIANLQGSGISVAMPASSTLTFTVTATVASTTPAGNLTNTATITAPAGTNEPNPFNNTASDTNTVTLTADLFVTKTDGKAGITPGSVYNYTLTFNNVGPSSANNALISDPIATNLTKLVIGACTAAGGAVCPTAGAGAGQLNITNLEAGTVVVPILPNGGSISFNVTVQVASDVMGAPSVTNTATITAPAGTTNTGTSCTTSGGVTRSFNTNTGVCTSTDIDQIQPGAPTAVQLISFTAAGNATGGATLQWRTGYEADNLGFNVYRDERGKRVKLNPALVAGSALLAGRRTILTAGNGYAWTDPQGTSGTAYWLEDVDVNGVSTWRGPVYVSGGATSSTKPGVRTLATRQAPLLSELNEAANQDTQQEWAASAGELVQVNGLEIEAQASAPLLLAQVSQSTWTLPNEAAAKLSVRKTGWYRVTAAELTAVGFNPNVNPALLQLSAEGVEAPIRVFGKGNSLDYLEFYGRAFDTPATDTRVYWLKVGQSQGLRLEARAGKAAQTASVTSFRSTIERKDRLIYFSGLLNGEAENWFGPVISANGASQKLTTRFLDRTAGNCALEFVLQGVTDQAHTINIEVNGRAAGMLTFAGKNRLVSTLSVPTSLLLDGVNEIRLVAVAGGSDISLVECVRLSYQRSYMAVDNALSFTLGAGQTAFIGGFGSPNIRVLELGANDSAVREVVVKAQVAGSSYGFSLQSETNGRYLALGDQQFERVASAKLNTVSNWRATTNAADFVILTHRDFWAAANRLATARRSQELRVAVVDIEDVYDEFSYGVKSPQAVKDLLTTARTTWLVKPKYALLIGDATSDPRDYLGLGNADFVPTKLGATNYFETALDNWLADANDDTLPELALGRLPVRTAAQADALVTKILAFKPSATAPRAALLVSDRTVDGVNYQAQSNQYAGALLPLMMKQFVNRNDGAPDQVRAQILNTINLNKPLVVNWAGHGSTQVWTGDGLLRAQDATSLTNTAHSLFVMATCLNGYFLDPSQISLGEAVLLNTTGGAFAVVSSSGLNLPAPQHIFNQTLYQNLFGLGKTLGEAVTAARLTAGDKDVRNSFVLLGDPTLKLR